MLQNCPLKVRHRQARVAKLLQHFLLNDVFTQCLLRIPTVMIDPIHFNNEWFLKFFTKPLPHHDILLNLVFITIILGMKSFNLSQSLKDFLLEFAVNRFMHLWQHLVSHRNCKVLVPK